MRLNSSCASIVVTMTNLTDAKHLSRSSGKVHPSHRTLYGSNQKWNRSDDSFYFILFIFNSKNNVEGSTIVGRIALVISNKHTNKYKRASYFGIRLIGLVWIGN